ncbi:MAG TPA: NAD(P)/FAD-dependent oxidoreductase [Polyangiaceae bacterium]|nr:NAD(P)/FAD-dependent oxidoreductase [Polyangiaceae bacterium]
MKAIVIGSGPVGCMTAMRFRERGWDVQICEGGSDPRTLRRRSRRSINLTLSRRGLRTLPAEIQSTLYEQGVPCVTRIVHHRDGSVTSQAYGLTSEEHLLSISRELLNRILLDCAERAGVRIDFGQECVQADLERASATFLSQGELRSLQADVLVGCDGTNSTVRHEMSRRGARMSLSQSFIAHSYIELAVPVAPDGGYAWGRTEASLSSNGQTERGLHVWPRGTHMLLALPNLDQSYTASLFIPTVSTAADEPSFKTLDSPSRVQEFFQTYFSDAVPHIPNLSQEFLSKVPATLRTLKCDPYHFGRAVLLGDAAHTMVPFFGQGVNSGFEDVQVFFSVLDKAHGGETLEQQVRRTVSDFTRLRRPSAHAITDLSLGNFRELVDHSGQPAFQARHAIERALYLRYPQRFRPLLNMVSFAELSYDEVAKIHKVQSAKLDRCCQLFDPVHQPERVIRAYLDESDAASSGEFEVAVSSLS